MKDDMFNADEIELVGLASHRAVNHWIARVAVAAQAIVEHEDFHRSLAFLAVTSKMLCQQRMSLSRAIKSKIDNLSGVQLEIGDAGEEQHVRTDGMKIVLDKAMLEYMVSLCDVNVVESKPENLPPEVEENCAAFIVVKIVRAAACLMLMLTNSPEHELLTTNADGRLSVPAKNMGCASFHSFGNAVEADLFGGIFVLGGWQNKTQSGVLLCFTDESFVQESIVPPLSAIFSFGSEDLDNEPYGEPAEDISDEVKAINRINSSDCSHVVSPLLHIDVHPDNIRKWTTTALVTTKRSARSSIL